MQVNLGKLLTGLGSGDLLHPQNSVLGATVSRAALYDSVQAENAALRSEVLELKTGPTYKSCIRMERFAKLRVADSPQRVDINLHAGPS